MDLIKGNCGASANTGMLLYIWLHNFMQSSKDPYPPICFQEAALRIYPNPEKGGFTVLLPAEGKGIWESPFSSGELLTLPSLSRGLYSIAIKSEKRYYSVKLMID